MANWVQNDWTRTQTKANQASIIGNPRPPNMAQINPNMLKAASPKYFNLQQATGVDTTSSDTAATFCRTNYVGFTGLRKLQQDQANRTYYDAGCGWRFSMGTGNGNPTINQAALGSYNGPVYGGTGDLDEVANSTTWDMNLQRAERNASAALATNLNNKCTNLQYLSAENQLNFGFCTSSGAIIPIETDAAGNVTARYQKDITLGCPSANIIPGTSAPGACPSGPGNTTANSQKQTQKQTQGFRNPNPSSQKQGMGMKGDLREAFEQPSFMGSQKKKITELFVGGKSINELSQCSSPLTPDCVILAARAAGCGDQGSLITALEGIPKGQEYNKNLQNNQAYLAYNQAANPSVTPSLLKDGTVSLATALADFGNILTNVQSKNPKVAAASRDLCIQSGYFQDSYDWCADISPTTIIDATNIGCVQNDWRNQGGTPQGTAYPSLVMWEGKTFQSYLSYVQNLLTQTTSVIKETQNSALLQFIGTTSSYHSKQRIVKQVDVLPTFTNTNGAETVWIDLGDYWNGSTPPIILRCDLNMSEKGEIIPKMVNDYTDLKNKYNLPNQTGIAFINAFEYRVKSDTTLKFNVTVDDGFMIGYNQNPFEETRNKKYDWGSWSYQAPTPYLSGSYNIVKDSEQTTNTFVTKYFQGQGQSRFIMTVKDGQGAYLDPSIDTNTRMNMFLTQEPYAPWMQYEVVNRPNSGKGTALGFFEKRWNGPVAYYESKGVDSPIPSFDVVSGSVVTQTDKKLIYSVPNNKAYITFSSSSWWHTRALFAFTAFKTITLLVRPTASLSAGSFSSVFQHMNFVNFAVNLWLYTGDGKNYMFAFWNNSVMNYLPCVIDEWNLVVIQYNSDTQGIRNVQADAMDLTTLQTSGGLNTMFARISNHQNPSGAVIMPPITNESQRNVGAGYLILGGSCKDYSLQAGDQKNIQSFTGDIAWLHGFRTAIETLDMLNVEVQQSWACRWPTNSDQPPLSPIASSAPTKPCNSSAGTGVTIYQHCEATGWSVQLPVGDHDLIAKVGTTFPLDASYIKVPLGFRATIYNGTIGVGKSKVFEGPTRWNFCDEGSWANDKIRSIRVEASAGNECYTSKKKEVSGFSSGPITKQGPTVRQVSPTKQEPPTKQGPSTRQLPNTGVVIQKESSEPTCAIV